MRVGFIGFFESIVCDISNFCLFVCLGLFLSWFVVCSFWLWLVGSVSLCGLAFVGSIGYVIWIRGIMHSIDGYGYGYG